MNLLYKIQEICCKKQTHYKLIYLIASGLNGDERCKFYLQSKFMSQSGSHYN